jgi:hypothetical protein
VVTSCTGCGPRFPAFSFHFAVASDAVLQHDLFLSELPLFFQSVDAARLPGEKIVANIAAFKRVLVPVMGKVDIVCPVVWYHKMFRAPVFTRGLRRHGGQK